MDFINETTVTDLKFKDYEGITVEEIIIRDKEEEKILQEVEHL